MSTDPRPAPGLAPVVRANDGNLNEVANILAAACEPLELAKWLVPDEQERGERQRILRAVARIHISHALKYGDVHITDDRAGAAIWLPRTTFRPDIAYYQHRLHHACGRHIERFRILDQVLAEHQPDEAHYRLVFLAVDPAQQQHGVAGLLLDTYHTWIDTSRIPVHLTAVSSHSRVIAHRHGYTHHGHPVHLPNGPTLWPMRRHTSDPGTSQ